MRDIGAQTRRELKLIPAKVVVLEHAAHSYACRHCEQNDVRVPFACAKAPAPLLAGSLASPSLVAHIAVQKYTNGMPLYRLENGFQYDGVAVSRQNMANWVIRCSQRYLEGLYELLKKHLLCEHELHADETAHQVLCEPGRAAKTKSYEWLYRTSGCSKRKIAIYEYQQTRSQEHPRAFLEGFTGLLHTDGYQAYHNLPPGITVIGCWSHVRRRFEAILKKLPQEQRRDSEAWQGVAYINALFDSERKFARLTPEERYSERLEKSKPVADAFFAWAAGLRALPKSPLGDAVGYAFSQRKYLENAFLDGRAEISNNRAERSIKPFVMGRKAWLFSATPAGARASSVMYSIIETAKKTACTPTVIWSSCSPYGRAPPPTIWNPCCRGAKPCRNIAVRQKKMRRLPMPRKSHTKLMFEFVQDYLSGEMERMFFDLDFNHYLIQYYPAMARQDPDMADCFVYYLSEQGMDASEHLSDAEHKKLIRKQWNEFQSALNDGLF